MGAEQRLMSNLINVLNNVKIKLEELKNGGAANECFPPPDKCQSFTIMKNVLHSLVKKIVDGKNCDDDIVTCSERQYYNEEPEFQNLISSEEYLEQTKRILTITTKPNVILTFLLNFHELLGDILYSICQINNYKMRGPSKIVVADLINVNNQYISIWNLISSTKSIKVTTDNALYLNDYLLKNELEVKVVELQRALQLGLKEMYKVKLEIEHYLKVNLIEMRFETSANNAIIRDSNMNVNEMFINQNQQETVEVVGENSSDTKSSVFNGSSQSAEEKLFNFPLFQTGIKQTDSKEENLNLFLLPPNSTGYMIPPGQNPTKKSFGDVFSNSLIYHPDFLGFDPVFNKPKVLKASLSKLHDTESSTKDSCSNATNIKDAEKVLKICKKVKNNKILKNICQFVENSAEDDLFEENLKTEPNKTQSLELQKKISSLFDILRKNKTNKNENIFDANSLKIEYSDSLLSKPVRKPSSAKLDMYKKTDVIHQITKPTFKTKKKTSKSLKNTSKFHISENEKCNRTLFKSMDHKNINTDFSKMYPKNDNETVIYDQRSLIEIFRTSKEKHCSNSEPYPQEGSSFCMWPVAAEYIYTSKIKRCNPCSTVSSNNSISLPKSFEQSFFSLHLNKKYEQKQFYDGDLIVLKNPKLCENGPDSKYTFLNRSCEISHVPQNNIKQSSFMNYNEKPENNIKKHPFDNEIIPNLNTFNNKNTVAVHYTNCDDSFIKKNELKTFRRENLDFWKINGYDENKNWNSFISVFTSKVGPTARINHHRMFHKIINNIGSEPMFGNVRTLTSNGGPFRLFDINGYPLTDSAGNVLKDPYSKAVVDLDPTGFPRDEVNVFDAAGNTPNDVSFDPTQKPKTNTIIIKLTDNFKRPLHLFDKYGRPLTDSYGKLLVNIHGRPLLRFDNFGRPSTDYRGGPLYTDNGFRWSCKTGESVSNEQLGNDCNDDLKTKTFNESCEPIVKCPFPGLNENCDESDLQEDEFSRVTTTCSDIWIKVENVLEHLPKKRKGVETKTSQSCMTVTHKVLEQEFLKPIIYHNNIIELDTNHKYSSRCHKDSNNHKELFNISELKDWFSKETNFLEESKINKITKGFLENSHDKTITFPLYNNILVQRKCSKCFRCTTNKTCQQEQLERLVAEKSGKTLNKINIENDLLLEREFLANKLLKNTSNWNTKINMVKTNSSNIKFKKHDYLDKLCNQILKFEVDRKNRGKQNLDTECRPTTKDENWSDTSQTFFTSSLVSKYTSELPNESCEGVKGTVNSYSRTNSFNPNKKNTQCNEPLKSNNQGLLGKAKHLQDYFRSKSPFGVTLEQNESKTCATKANIQLSEEESLSGNTFNGEKHEIEKEAEMHKSEPKVLTSLNNSYSKKSAAIIKPKMKKAVKRFSRTKDDTLNFTKSNNLKHCNKTIDDSPFRFPSDNPILDSSFTENDDKCVQKEYVDLNYSTSYKRNSKHPKNNNEVKINEKRLQNKNFNNGEKNENKVKCDNYVNSIPTGSERHRDMNYNIFHESKDSNSGSKVINALKTPVQEKTECNLVSFLGSPVKYVLNKLDSKRSPKPKEYNARNTAKDRLTNTIHNKDINKHVNELNIKTLYVSEPHKNKHLSNKDKLKGKRMELAKPVIKQRNELIAFQSKSCYHLISEPMSYSGNEESTLQGNTNNIIYPSNTDTRKCSSATSFETRQRRQPHPLRRGLKLGRQHKDKFDYKSNTPKRKEEVPFYNREKTTKGYKHFTGKYLESSINKKKEISLLKKLESKVNYGKKNH